MSVVVSSLNALPRGFCFSPTKEEVLLYYLGPAIRREPLPYDILMKVDIYGDNKEPWKLFDKESQHPFWVFTRLKRKSKSKVERIAGCGCWLNRATQEVHNSRGKLIGFDRYFTFTPNSKKGQRQGSRDSNGNWIMHEYSLIEEGLEDYVLCQIKNKAAGNKKRKTADDYDFDDDHDVSEVMSVTVTKKKKICFDTELMNSSSSTTCLTNYEQNQNDDELRDTSIMNQSFCPQLQYQAINTEETPSQLEVTSASVSSVNSDAIVHDSLLVDSTKKVWGSSSGDEWSTGRGVSVELSYDQEVYNIAMDMDQTMPFCLQANTEGTPAGQLEITSASVSSVNPSDDIINDSLLVASTKKVWGAGSGDEWSGRGSSMELCYGHQEVYNPIMDQTMLMISSSDSLGNIDEENGKFDNFNDYVSINPNDESIFPEAILYDYDPTDWNEYLSIDELY